MRKNERMKWKQCRKCGRRVYLHRPESHVCGVEVSVRHNTDRAKRIICERCLKKFEGYPAISRRDNKTEICSDCGVAEAMFDFAVHKLHITNAEIKEERKWLD